MIEAIKAFFHFLAFLARPGSTAFLIAFAVVLAVALAAVIAVLFVLLSAWGKDERFNKALKLGTVWVHFVGGPNNPAEAGKAVTAETGELSYRKLLYVKVVYLTKEAPGVAPVYVRNVERLAEGERAVKVYDEAVYYTLKRFPVQQPIPPETDSSSGIVESRLLVPWTDIDEKPFAYRDQHSTEITSEESSDTLCAVSHFLNGLQKSGEQTFCTFADQDAATLSLVVDFSSIPDAGARVTLKEANVVTSTRRTRLPCKNDGNVFSVQYEHAKKGELLQMEFAFSGWDGPRA